ncbi:hypothetical protein E2C01_062126 [Portunus trituberculatus]|uniref:Uncharacterized protein n=1 Tax=Portunus trituberculatus TaxID=210409 RepID=A0A5B7HDQ3_PORTR|nr:hypothetical protein [Portunus trituberculatus]
MEKNSSITAVFSGDGDCWEYLLHRHPIILIHNCPVLKSRSRLKAASSYFGNLPSSTPRNC